MRAASSASRPFIPDTGCKRTPMGESTSAEAILAAVPRCTEDQFDEGLRDLVAERRAAGDRLDAALGYLVSYVEVLVRLLGDGLDHVPAVRAPGALSREGAAELFLRVAYSHYVLPHPDSETLHTDRFDKPTGFEPATSTLARRRFCAAPVTPKEGARSAAPRPRSPSRRRGRGGCGHGRSPCRGR